MRVMPAGVHHAGLLAVEGGGHLGSEGQAGALGHRQRVHVGAQCDARARTAALDDRDHAVVCDAGAGFQAQRAQVFGHLRRGLHLAVGKLGELVEMAAQRDHLLAQALGGSIDLGTSGPVLCDHGGGREQTGEQDGQ